MLNNPLNDTTMDLAGFLNFPDLLGVKQVSRDSPSTDKEETNTTQRRQRRYSTGTRKEDQGLTALLATLSGSHIHH